MSRRWSTDYNFVVRFFIGFENVVQCYVIVRLTCKCVIQDRLNRFVNRSLLIVLRCYFNCTLHHIGGFAFIPLLLYFCFSCFFWLLFHYSTSVFVHKTLHSKLILSMATFRPLRGTTFCIICENCSSHGGLKLLD